LIGSPLFVQGDEIGARDRENETRTGGLFGGVAQRPTGDGKSLVQLFLYCVVIGLFAAYLFGRTLAPGAAFLQVFRVVGIAALLGYGAAHAQESIWNGRSWVVTFKHLFDSVIYAALTAGTFGWLSPKSL
jgi:hypothetical protein